MDKKNKTKQSTEKPVMTVTKPAKPAVAPVVVEPKQVEPKKEVVIVEAPSKKKRYRKPVKKQTTPVVPAKKLNWFQKLVQKIYKWL